MYDYNILSQIRKKWNLILCTYFFIYQKKHKNMHKYKYERNTHHIF